MWEKKSDKGIWSEYVNPDTNESSIKTHELREVKTFCKQEDHNFKPLSLNSRELVCTKCGAGSHYVLGIQKLENGKVTNL